MPTEENDPIGSINITTDKETGETGAADIIISPAETINQLETHDDRKEEVEEILEEDLFPGASRRKLPSPWVPRVKYSLISICIFIIIYSLVGFFGVPYVVKSYLPEITATNINRPVTIGSARFNPYTLKLQINNAIIGPDLTNADDKIDPLFSAATIATNLSFTSLFSWGLNCSEMTIDGLFLHVQRDEEENYNLLKIFPLQSSTTFPFLNIPFSYFIQNFTLSNGHILLDDIPTKKNHELTDISISLPVLFHSTGRKNTVPRNKNGDKDFIHPHFSAMINGSPFEVKGQTRLDGEIFEARLQLHLDSIDLPSYLSYLPRQEKLTIESGRADLAMELTFITENNKKPSLEIETVCRMENVRLRSEKNKTNVFPDTRVRATLFPLTQHYLIKEISVNEPELHMGIDIDGTWYFPPIFNWLAKPSTYIEKKSDNSSKISMENITLTKGKLIFIDQKVSGGFTETVSGIDFTLTKAEDNKQTLSPFSLTAFSPGKNKTDIKGNISFSPLQIKGLIKSEKISLKSFSHYLPHEKNLQIKEGQLTDFASTFSFTSPQKNTKKSIAFGHTTATISHLVIGDQTKEWLNTPQANISFEDFDPAIGQFNQLNIKAQSPYFFLQWDNENLFNWKNALPYQFSDTSLDLINASLHIENLSQTSPLELQIQDAAIKATNLTTNSDQKGNFSIEATLNQADTKGNFQSQGHITLSPFSSEFQCKVTQYDITAIPELIEKWLNIPVVSGELEADGSVKLPQFSFNGTLSLLNFAVNDKKEKIFGWSKAKSEKLSITTSPLSLVSSEISINGPIFNWIIADNETKSSTLLDTFHQVSQNFKDDTVSRSFQIDRINLIAGKLIYSDRCANPIFSKRFEMSGSLANFTTNPTGLSTIDIELNENAEKKGKINGSMALFADKLSADIHASFTKQQIHEFSPYLESLYSYSFTSGLFDFSTHYRLEQDKISADNSFLISNLQFSKPKTAVNQFPLTHAIFLQNNGHIDLKIPFRGDNTDLNYSFATALGRSLRNIVLKTTVSPFSQLNTSFPDQETVVDYLLFEPGTEKLSQENKKQLTVLSHILKNRPKLLVSIKGFAGYDSDQEALLKLKKEKDFQQKLLNEKEKPSQIIQGYGKEEINLFLSETNNSAKEIKEITVDKNDLLQLARKRQQSISEFLISSGITRSRVLQDKDISIVFKNAPGKPGNRVDFQLKAETTDN